MECLGGSSLVQSLLYSPSCRLDCSRMSIAMSGGIKVTKNGRYFLLTFVYVLTKRKQVLTISGFRKTSYVKGTTLPGSFEFHENQLSVWILMTRETFPGRQIL
jgi:hypothetical protein